MSVAPSSSPIRDGFVVILSRQHLSSHRNANHIHQQHNPRNRAKNPTRIQLPTNKEAIIVIKEESLYIMSVIFFSHVFKIQKLTTMPMAATWQTTTTPNRPAHIFQPPSLLLLPPNSTTAKATKVANSSTTEKFIRKPTLLHMEQKYRSSPWQSSGTGKGVQPEVREEQRRCRP